MSELTIDKIIDTMNQAADEKDTRITALELENAALKLQAQSWAIEAKGQRNTVHECLQAVSGSSGEKADWNGSRPVKEKLEALEAEVKRLREALQPFKAKADECAACVSTSKCGDTYKIEVDLGHIRNAAKAMEQS
jgi:prefoldin subunit 5